MRRFKPLLLLLIACWLPVQAAYALAMPFCRHAAEQTREVEAGGMPCHEAVAVPVAADHDAGCDDCAACHLATAAYLPAVAVCAFLDVAAELVTLPELATPSHIGDPPRQPPRRVN